LSAFIISSNANGVIPFFCHLSTTASAMQEACSFQGKRNFQAENAEFLNAVTSGRDCCKRFGSSAMFSLARAGVREKAGCRPFVHLPAISSQGLWRAKVAFW
jgi:hypothetical protein